MKWQLVPAQTFPRHAAAWDRLQRRVAPVPFLESTFIAPLLDAFGDGTEILALLGDGETLRAATLLRPRGRGRWETFQPSQLPLGPWIGESKDLVEQMDGLLHRLPGLALGLGVTQIDPDYLARPGHGAPSARTLDYVSTSFIDIQGDFDTYWESRGKNLRQNTRKQRTRLRSDGVEPRLDCVTEAADVARALAEYGALEGMGWKADTGTAILPDNEQGRFYRRMLEAFCDLGRGRIYRYHFNDKVAAMDLCIDHGPLVVILKTAYDESLRQVSPSTLMRQEEFASWWKEGRYRRIEFYGKTLEWHTRWTDRTRILYHATTYRWPWLANLAARRPAAPTPVEAGGNVASS